MKMKKGDSADQDGAGEGAPGDKSGAGSKTVERTLGLLKLVASAPTEGLRLMDLADLSGLDRSTAYRLVSSLVRFNLVDQDTDNKRYTLGLEFFALAAAAANRHDLSARARTALEDLAKSTGDSITYCLRSGHDLICVDVETGRTEIKNLPMDIGSRRPIGSDATGLALLAALSDHEAEQSLELVKDRLARRKSTSLPAILAERTATIARGYALGPDAPDGQVWGLSIPLIARNGRPIGTLTINGHPDRFGEDRVAGLAALLREQARMLYDELSSRRVRPDQKTNLS